MGWTSALRRAVGGVALAALAACDSSTGNKEPGITLTPSATSASIGQGGSTTITLTVQRSHFDGTVLFVVQGVPDGVTAVASPSGLTASETSTTLTIAASGATTPGSAVLSVKATGSGIADQSVNINLTVTVTGTFALSALNPSVTVAQGGGGNGTVLIPRAGGNAGSVTLAVSGLPAGITASLGASPTTTTSSLVTFAATAGVAPGNYTATFTGSSPGLATLTTTITVVVIPPPSTANISIPFCADDLPVWFAYQNEGYSWQQVPLTGTAFNFAATQRLSVAYVFSGGGDTQINIFNVTRAEFSASNDRDCAGTRSYTGSLAGVTTGKLVKIVMGTSIGTGSTAGIYALTSVPSRPLDLVATLGDPSGDFLKPDKIIVRRALDLANNAVIPTLDFAAAEAFVPTSTNLTVNGLNAADQIELQNTFWTVTSTFGTAHSAQPTTATLSSGTPLYSVPAVQQVAGDLHELYIDAAQSTSSSIAGRTYVEYFATPADRTVQFSPNLSIPTISTIAVSPFARTRGVLSVQPDYNGLAEFAYIQDTPSGASRVVLVGTSSGYLGATPTSWDIVVPDLTGTAGFNASWMLGANLNTVYFAEAFSGRAELLFGALPAQNDIARLAYRAALTNTSQLFRMPGVPRAGRRLPQYLRR